MRAKPICGKINIKNSKEIKGSKMAIHSTQKGDCFRSYMHWIIYAWIFAL